MPLPALALREKILYKDRATFYAPTLNANGDTNGYAVAVWTDGVTLLTNVPCNAHLTPNFDSPRSPAGQDKVTNYETSNNLTLQRQIVVDPKWSAYVTTRWGESYWFTVDGDSERETLVPCTCIFMVPALPLPGVIPPTQTPGTPIPAGPVIQPTAPTI